MKSETDMEGAQNFIDDHSEPDECEGCMLPMAHENRIKNIRELIAIIDRLESGQKMTDMERVEVADLRKWLKSIDEFDAKRRAG